MERTPISRFINTCWYFFKLGAMLITLLVIGVAVFLFTRMDDEIRYQVENALAEAFPKLNVSVGGARLVEGRGIAIYDLALSETSNTHLQSNLILIDEIMLSCDVQLSKLVQGLPQVKRVVIKHPQLWLTRNATGRWNFESLLPLPPAAEVRPTIELVNAQFAVSDLARPMLPQLALRDIHLIIDGSEQITKLQQDRAKIQLTNNHSPSSEMTIKVHGSVSGENIRRADLKAKYHVHNHSFEVDGDFEGLKLSQDMQAWAIACCEKLTPSTSFAGRLGGKFSIRHQLASQSPPQIDANLQISKGRIEDPRLPRPLRSVRGNINWHNEVFKLEAFQARCDTANIAMQMERRGWHEDATLAAAIRIEELPLDKKLYQVLPAVLQSEWNKYRPEGMVNASAQVTFDGQEWRPTATLVGKDLSFESDKFRYRVHEGGGKIQYTPASSNQPAVLDIDMNGVAGGRQLKLLGQFFDPRPGALGWLEITGIGLDIEQRMIAALPDKTRHVIESLHPQGKFNVRWRLDRTQPEQEKPHTSLRLELSDCRVNYDKFPYPLSKISGLIIAEDQEWTFRDLVSKGSRKVECQGYLRPLNGAKELSLQFTGKQLPLDGDLKQALPLESQKAWEQLRPTGNVDLIADVYNYTGYAKPVISVSVSPRPETATIQPIFFPYLMKQLQGRLEYQNGNLLITDFRAKHGPTSIRTNGNGKFSEDGTWQVELTGLSADRLEARRDLLVALPPKLRKAIELLRLSGKFSLSNAMLKFSKPSNLSAEIQANWDVEVNCMQTDLRPGIDLENVHGTVRLVGASQGNNTYSAGELALETLTFEDVQFTNIRGPIWIDETSCLLGEWATKRQQLTPRRVSGQVYGGSLISDAWITYDGVPRYSITASLEGADMRRMSKERFHTDQDYLGKLAATMTVDGYGRSMHTLTGHGEVRVTEANIYELPLLVGMLKVLRNGTPDTTAFNQVDAKYRIQGRHIYLDKIDFLGDAVSLLGKGETNFDHQLNLVFHGIVGRNQIQLPLVKNFFSEVGQQTLQMYVDGTLDNPQIHTQALPGINNLIQQIQTDLDTTSPYSNPNPRKAERSFPTLPRWGSQR